MHGVLTMPYDRSLILDVLPLTSAGYIVASILLALVYSLVVLHRRSTTDAEIRDERAKSPKHEMWRVVITASASSKVASLALPRH